MVHLENSNGGIHQIDGNGGAFKSDAKCNGAASDPSQTDSSTFGRVLITWALLGVFVIWGPFSYRDITIDVPDDEFIFGRTISKYYPAMVEIVLFSLVIFWFVIMTMRWTPLAVIWFCFLIFFYTFFRVYLVLSVHPTLSMAEADSRLVEFWRRRRIVEYLLMGTSVTVLLTFSCVWCIIQELLSLVGFKLIKESNRTSIHKLWLITFVPILPSLMQAALFAFAVKFSEVLSTSGQLDGIATLIHIFNAIVYLSTSLFLTAVSEMVLASIFMHWYWTYKKDDVSIAVYGKALTSVYEYYLKNGVFGSSSQVRQKSGQEAKECDCSRPLSQNASVMCATHGTPFRSKGPQAKQLIARGRLELVVSFLCKLILSMGIATLPMFYDYGSDVSNILVAMALLCFGLIFIAEQFFAVYQSAVDTLVFCFDKDFKRNDGSEERPYYANKRLKNILLGKANDETTDRKHYNNY